MAGSSLVVFNDQLWDSSAGRLGPAYGQAELLAQLQAGLVDAGAFGVIEGAAEAAQRLDQAVTQLSEGYTANGVNLETLAADARTAADISRQTVDDTTESALRADPSNLIAFQNDYSAENSWEGSPR